MTLLARGLSAGLLVSQAKQGPVVTTGIATWRWMDGEIPCQLYFLAAQQSAVLGVSRGFLSDGLESRKDLVVFNNAVRKLVLNVALSSGHFNGLFPPKHKSQLKCLKG